MYTHRKFDSQNGPFEPESSFTGIKFQEVWERYGRELAAEPAELLRIFNF
jgi:hypothetical protein